MAAGTKAREIERTAFPAVDSIAPPRARLPAWLRADPKSALILAALIIIAIAAAVPVRNVFGQSLAFTFATEPACFVVARATETLQPKRSSTARHRAPPSLLH